MIYEIVHTTQYDYDAPVTASYAQVYQLPLDIDGQTCVRRSVTTEPAAEHYREHQDYFGNRTALLEIREPHTSLIVRSTSTVDTAARATTTPDAAAADWTTFVEDPGQRPTDLVRAEFVLDSPLVRRSTMLADYAKTDFGPDVSLAAALVALNHRIFTEFTFDPKATEVDTPLAEVFESRKGVCQDFAHILIGCLRSIGLPACYVSGYLETLPPPGQARLTGADRTHAWVGVYVGDDQWIGIDPTNDQLAGPRYVTTARGRDYGDVPPLKGVIFTDAETSTLQVSVDVAPQTG